jgi:hypothetical protein
MMIEHGQLRGGKPPRFNFLYLRKSVVPAAPPGPQSLTPYTVILAEQLLDGMLDGMREIYWINLRAAGWWGGDGISPVYLTRHHSIASQIVCAKTLLPLPPRRYRRKLTKAERRWAIAYKRTMVLRWRNQLAAIARSQDIQRLRHESELSWLDRRRATVERWARHFLLEPSPTAYEILWRGAEIGPVHWFNNNQPSAGYYSFVRQAIVQLKPGQNIRPNTLPGREVIGTIPVAKHLFSDANVPVLQRCFYLSHLLGNNNHVDGIDPDPKGDYSDAIPLRSVRVGFPSPRFDPRDIMPVSATDKNGIGYPRKAAWMATHRAAQLKQLRNKGQ